MKYILNQTIASTHVDLQGEQYSKEFFETILKQISKRMPLNVSHDFNNDEIGYLENFKIVKDPDSFDNWLVKADIHYLTENIDEALKGFSFSVNIELASNSKRPLYQILLPFPLYNDKIFINELLSEFEDITIDKWIKKGLTGLEIGLIVSGLVFIISPEWELQYKKKIRPFLKKVFAQKEKIESKNIFCDISFSIIGYKDENIKLFFMERNKKHIINYEKSIKNGCNLAMNLLLKNQKAKDIGVDKINLSYNYISNKYVISNIRYLDGSVNN